MRRIVLFDHLDRRAAVLGDLVDVRTFHEPEADIGMPQAIGRAPIAVAVELQAGLRQHVVEELYVVAGEH